jgi:Glu-tRNA(Gln) amidotransferase subunit E-like FAD-binding protein
MKDKKTTDNKKDSIYKQMGFMCGLEIHQRLATQHEKLFCSMHYKNTWQVNKASIASVTRYQRAVAGELRNH